MGELLLGDVTVVRAVLPNPDNYDEVLLLRRLPTSRNNPGLWELPGGKFDPPEPGTTDSVLLAAGVLEIEEETGFEVKIRGNSLSLIDRYIMRGEPWDGKLYVAYAGVARYMAGSLRLSPEHTDSRWVQPEAMPADLPLTAHASKALGLYRNLVLGVQDAI